MADYRPTLRSVPDRVRQVFLFEAGGLLLLTPAFAWASGVALGESAGLLALLAVLAALWNAAFNTAFDWAEARLACRGADCRPVALRVAHAVGFEGGFLLVSLPVVIVWTGMGWFEALVADAALALAYVVYAFGFNLAYDRAFPIMPRTLGAAARAD